MDGLTPNTLSLAEEPEAWQVPRARRAVNSRPHVLLTGASATVLAQVRAAIGDDYAVLAVPDGRRALRVLRCIRHLLLVVACDDLLSMDAPGLFARLAADPELASRHTCVYLTSGLRHFDVTFAWHLELVHATVIHVPTAELDLLDSVATAARHARFQALVGSQIGERERRDDERMLP